MPGAAGWCRGCGTNTHLAPVDAHLQRLDLAGAPSPGTPSGRSPRSRASPDLGHRLGPPVGVWDRGDRLQLDAVSGDPGRLISGDGHHAWLRTTALMLPRDAGAARWCGWWFAAYPTGRSSAATAPRPAYRRSRSRGRRGITGLVDFEFGASQPEDGSSGGTRVRPAAGAVGDLRRHPRRRRRGRSAHRDPSGATRG